MNNFFEGDEFSLVSMTEAMNVLPVIPSRFGARNIFSGGGINTTTVTIEQLDGNLRLIPTAQRGSMPNYDSNDKRVMRAIPVPHLPKNDTIIAESVQGVRAFGSATELEQVQTVVNNKLLELKQEHEATWEWMRTGALQGIILDADGSTPIVNLFTEFDVTRLAVNWDTSDVNGLKLACIDLRRKMQDAMQLMPWSSIQVECSEEFWDAILTSPETKDAYNRYQDNAFARDSNYAPFMYSQVSFEELRGYVGTTPFVPEDEGFAYPVTPANIFRRFSAPGTFMETVNTIGLDYYAKQEPLKFNTGTEIHTQSNPLFLCTRPQVLFQFTLSE